VKFVGSLKMHHRQLGGYVKKNYRIAIISLTALSVLAGGGYGAWVAWDTGAIGNNPRAPTPKAMEDAVRKQALYLSVTTGAKEPCVKIELNRPQPEINGVPGIVPRQAPGQHALTLLLQTNAREQPARDLQLAQLNFLTAQGFFTAADTTFEMGDGVARPARIYRLTWEGYAKAQQSYGSMFCLPYGRREFAGIGTIERPSEKTMDLDVYEVEYQTKVSGIPAWATAPEANRLFPKLAELTSDLSGKANVIRTREGWRSAYEVESEISSTAKGLATDVQRKEIQKRLDNPPDITLDEAKSLLAKKVVDPEWALRNGVACLPIMVQRGGDDKEMQVDREASEFSVTYHDRGDRNEFEYRAMATALHFLAALEGAGLAEMQVIRPAPPPMKAKANRRAAPQAQAAPTGPTGIRYKMAKDALTALGMKAYGLGCVPAGRVKVETLAVQNNRSQTLLLARASVEQTPEWSLKIAERLPALKTIIEIGLPMHGQLVRPPDGPDAGKWRLSGLYPSYPAPLYSSIPAHLAPLMPQTAAAFTQKTSKAFLPMLEKGGQASSPTKSSGSATQGEERALNNCADDWYTEESIRSNRRNQIAQQRQRGGDTSFEEKLNAESDQLAKARFMPKCGKYGFEWPKDIAGEARNNKTMDKLREKADAIAKARERSELADAIKNEAAGRSGGSDRARR
jgi:hypothetical protein